MSNKYSEGQVFGNLKLIRPTPKRKYGGYVVWACECKCGQALERPTNHLKGNSMCNACKFDKISSTNSKTGKHSKRRRLVRIGKEAISRCENTKNSNFQNYGGRGIEFKFKSLIDFVEWSLVNGYDEKKTIERKNVNGNYSPDNCCWIPSEEQARNKRNTPEFNGEKGLQAIAEYIGITNKTLQALIYKKGMAIEDVYKASKTEKSFFSGRYEKSKEKALNRSEEWKLKKEDVEKIIQLINDGVSRNHIATKVYKVDNKTIQKAIDRYNAGYYK